MSGRRWSLPRVPPVLEFLRDPRARHRNDASTARELTWREDDPGALPPGLELQWIGTAGFRLSYQGTTIWIDPYISRPGLVPVASRRTLATDDAHIARRVQTADAVLVGHTHFDHAMDVPVIARQHGCAVYGSESLRNLLGLYGLANQAIAVEPYHVYPVGPFDISFVPSRHSRLVLGMRVPSEGELTCEHLGALNAGAYKCGEVYGIHIAVAGVTFYHQGSADLIDDAIVHRDIDYFLAGIAGRGYTADYLARILRRLEPRVVVPNHHDNFFQPLDAPMGFSLNVNFGGFVEEVRAVSRDFDIRALALCQTVGAAT